MNGLQLILSCASKPMALNIFTYLLSNGETEQTLNKERRERCIDILYHMLHWELVLQNYHVFTHVRNFIHWNLPYSAVGDLSKELRRVVTMLTPRIDIQWKLYMKDRHVHMYKGCIDIVLCYYVAVLFCFVLFWIVNVLILIVCTFDCFLITFQDH